MFLRRVFVLAYISFMTLVKFLHQLKKCIERRLRVRHSLFCTRLKGEELK